VIGATPQPGVDLVESIAMFLERRRVLVILDNCEHVLAAAAAATLLDAAELAMATIDRLQRDQPQPARLNGTDGSRDV